ncbi:MAG: EVE domain-containing protein [Gemmatimonadales bacterium]|nr:EVE domain-containing protein [Gemmatimonadales bacterium]
MPGHWIVKTEPTTYSHADLVREKRTRWDGVANPVAIKHLKAMRPGDDVMIYHTGKEKAVVGLAR